jgi:hypothetical protein
MFKFAFECIWTLLMCGILGGILAAAKKTHWKHILEPQYATMEVELSVKNSTTVFMICSCPPYKLQITWNYIEYLFHCFLCLVWRRHAPSAQCQQVWHDASKPTSQLVTSLNVLLTGWCTRSSRAWSIRASCQGVPLQYYAARSIFSRLKKSFAQNPAILSLPASEFFTSVARFHDQRPQRELSLPHVSSVNTEMHGH